MRIFMISDFQLSTAKLDDLLKAKPTAVSLVTVSGKQSANLAIDSLWFSSPTHLLNGKEELAIELANYGKDNNDNITVELIINDRPAGISNVSVPAGGKETARLAFVNKTAGINRCEVRVNDAPIVFDNNFYFSYKVNDKLRIIEIQGKQANQAVKNLFADDADYLFTSYNEQSIDYNQLKTPGSLILNGLESISTGLLNVVLAKLQNGESVAIFPAKGADLSSYNGLLDKTSGIQLSSSDSSTSKVTVLESRHPFYRNIFEKIPANLDLPASKGGYLTKRGSFSKAQSLLRLQSGSDFLSVSNYKSGQLFLFSTPLNLENGNFAQHGLFAPIMLRIAESSGYIQQMYHTVGDSKPLEVKADVLPKENLFKLKPLKTGGREIIPQVRKTADNILLYLPAEDLVSGNFDIIGDASQPALGTIGVNLPRTESDTRLYTTDELEKFCEKSKGGLTLLDEKPEKITNEIKNHYQQQKLWKWFILCTLLFLTIEILITKWLK